MKKKLAIILLLLLLPLLAAGCTEEDPGWMIMQGATSDDTVQTVRVDSATHTLQTIEYEHAKIHIGDSYFVNVNDDAMNIGDTLDLTVITSNTTAWLHSTWSAEGTQAIHIFVYEDAVTNVAGTALTPRNSNRNSTNTVNATFRDGDTFNALGTLLWQWHTGDRKLAGSAGERGEMILKQATQYLFRIEVEVNGTAASGILNIYEQTNREP